MTALSSAGISVEVPDDWEGNITGGGFPLLAHGGRQPTVLHLASFPLPSQRGSFGSGAVEQMSNQDVFITLFEYGPESANTPLFSTPGIPQDLDTQDFDRHALQHAVRGQSGLQRFFTHRDRAFCLYVVLGSHIDRADLVPSVNAVLRTLAIS